MLYYRALSYFHSLCLVAVSADDVNDGTSVAEKVAEAGRIVSA